MDIYIDLTILMLFFNGICACYFLKMISQKKIKIIYYFLCGIISILDILFFYHNFYLIFFLNITILGILFYFLFKKNFFINLLTFIMFRYLSNLIIMICFHRLKFYNGLFFIENKFDFFILFTYPVIFLLIYLVTLFVDKSYHLSSYKNDVILLLNGKKYKIKAYFDTGNVLLYNQIPVIFMIENASPISKDNFKIEILTKTINGNKMYFAKEVLISLDGSEEYKCSYLCLIKKDSFNGCELLLNAYLF